MPICDSTRRKRGTQAHRGPRERIHLPRRSARWLDEADEMSTLSSRPPLPHRQLLTG